MYGRCDRGVVVWLPAPWRVTRAAIGIAQSPAERQRARGRAAGIRVPVRGLPSLSLGFSIVKHELVRRVVGRTE